MLRCAIFAVAILLATIVNLRAQSQEALPPKPQTQGSQEPAAHDQRGTEQFPAFVKIIPSPKTEAEAAKEAQDREEKSDSDRWLIRWTAAVAAFTFVLAAVGAWQGIQLKRSVDLLAQSERAQMFVIVHSEHLRFLISVAERHAKEGPDEEGVIYSDVADVTYSFKNYGKTPAIVREISARLVYGAKPPEKPSYIPTDQVLQEHMIASGEMTAVITPLDDVRPHRCKMDRELTIQEARDLARAQIYIWFYGRVLYDDSFGQQREHCFLWRYGGTHGFRPNYEYPQYTKNT